jgi:AcrR family transcriptional regulator
MQAKMPPRAIASNAATADRLNVAVNGTSRERVSEIQRARMLAAITEAACERGAANVTVAHVVSGAGVSRRTFYEIFADCEACLLAALDEGLARASERIGPGYRFSHPWRVRMRSSLAALLRLFDEEPSLGRLLVVEALAAGPRALVRRQRVLDVLAAAVDRGRAEAKTGAGPPPLAAEGVVGAVLSVIHGRMLDAPDKPLAELLNPLMSMIVLPYMGTAAARRELRVTVNRKAARKPPDKRSSNPLRDLDIRLTYRTVRTLTAVAAHPSSSNRAIADAAGIADQGQVSKLLTRLERLGLVQNTSIGGARGEPNAWTLTQAGREVHASLAS